MDRESLEIRLGRDLREAVLVVLLAVGGAVTYGVVNDQFTAHLAPQYFTIGHVDHLHVNTPFMLAFEWGFLGTWWVGLTLGILAAMIARLGWGAKVPAAWFVPRLVGLFGAMALAAAATWIVAYFLAGANAVDVPSVVRPGVVPSQRLTYYADWAANVASYAAGGCGALALLAWAGWRRLHASDVEPDRRWLEAVRHGLELVGAVAVVLAAALVVSGNMP